MKRDLLYHMVSSVYKTNLIKKGDAIYIFIVRKKVFVLPCVSKKKVLFFESIFWKEKVLFLKSINIQFYYRCIPSIELNSISLHHKFNTFNLILLG